MRPPACAAFLLLSAAAALLPGAVLATTFVRMGERALVDASIGAVRGRVKRVVAAADPATGSISTYVFIRSSAHLFGQFPGGTIVLREPGGSAAGREQRVFGSPEYRVGESVLVFLSRSADGALHTTGLSLGKFTLDERGGATRAVRHFGSEVALLDPQTGALETSAADESVELPTLLTRIHSALAERSATPATPVLRRPPELRRLAAIAAPAFAIFNPAVRWFQADAGTPIEYLVDTTGDATLGVAASRAAVDAGMSIWTGVSTASIVLEDAGDTEPIQVAGCPVENRIIFNDPLAEIDPPVRCQGTLAVTLVCPGEATETVNGQLFYEILSTKVTFNDGFGACPFWNACNLGEVATHELGHTVGLAHSDVANATMAAKAHLDGRCASIAPDDANALAFVYPVSPGVSPTPTASPSPTAIQTRTGTSPATQTPSRTAVRNPTSTATPALTPTRTASLRTPSQSATASPPPTASPRATDTPTPGSRPDEWLASVIRAVQQLLTSLGAARPAQ
jgi:hypothetical protein